MDAGRLLALLHDPRWLLSIGGDAVGLALQVLALATGPVALVQPLLVLAIPVALPAVWVLGGPRPSWADALACLAVVLGLAGFLLVVADPGPARVLSPSVCGTVLVVAAVAGVGVGLLVRRRRPAVQALGFGAVAGAWFGVVGVLIDAATRAFADQGLRSGTVLTCLAGVLVLGAGGLALSQAAFQVGSLAASFPASESAGPFVAVLLAGTVLGERVPSGPGALVSYALCLALVVLGVGRLAGSLQHPAEA